MDPVRVTEIPEAGVASKSWWREVTRKEWNALAAGFFGYALDAFDVMVYAFALTTLLKEWNLNPVEAGFLATVTLFSSAIGGIGAGAVADKLGRKKGIMATILLFSIFTGLSGLTQNLVQLAIARTILGLGMGGQWTAGVLLISETWSGKHRGKAIGIMQSGWAFGYVMAAIAAMFVLPLWGWRTLFIIGIIPGIFLLIWLALAVEETEMWKKAREEKKSTKLDFFQIFRADLIRYTIVITFASTFLMFAYWGLFTWMPGYLSTPVEKGGAGLSVLKSSGFMIPSMLGAWVGYVTFGFFADKFGRRPVFASYLAVAAVLVYVYGTVRDANTILLLGPLVGMFGSGAFSGFGAFCSECFPTRARGLGVGFTYNVGRMLSAVSPMVIGYFAGIYGMGSALGLTSLAYLLAGATIFLIPESKGKELE
ncbi:Putative metabolite transport protein YjhB [Sporomusa carbonis]|uniref:MFS transporter n=1 Tax=Sporomusa carbonis TaxID=3076075 RepID=UPI003A679AFB